MLARFRIKQDLYSYLNNQVKLVIMLIPMSIVGLFLPTYSGTKVVFMRAIVADQKKVLKQNQVTTMKIP